MGGAIGDADAQASAYAIVDAVELDGAVRDAVGWARAESLPAEHLTPNKSGRPPRNLSRGGLPPFSLSSSRRRATCTLAGFRRSAARFNLLPPMRSACQQR